MGYTLMIDALCIFVPGFSLFFAYYYILSAVIYRKTKLWNNILIVILAALSIVLINMSIDW